MGKDLQLRPEDFRNAWPHALARAMNEATQILDRIDAIESFQTAHQDRLEVLGEKMPAAIRAAENILTKGGQSVAKVIEESTERTLNEIAAISAQVQSDVQTTMETSHAEMEARIQGLLTSQVNFMAMIEKSFEENRLAMRQLKDEIIEERVKLLQAKTSASGGPLSRLMTRITDKSKSMW